MEEFKDTGASRQEIEEVIDSVVMELTIAGMNPGTSSLIVALAAKVVVLRKEVSGDT